MKKMKRWGVMTLVALLVLGSMGAALADDTETAKEPLEPGFAELTMDQELLGDVFDLITFVLYWGDPEQEDWDEWQDLDEPPTCVPPPPVVDPLPGEFCETLEVSHNGHVNHGSFVSSFVHWLKDDGMKALEYDGPKGQLVKWAAGQDFGKGDYDFAVGTDGLDDVLELEKADLDEAEEGDGHGPPDWVLTKKAVKAAKRNK
ncbi:MAG: hypothetical protein OEM84_06465 [Acidimicrobiia bacterium]|nr:hypothetical protein [Acidimicrobiia bacterium]